MVGNGLRREEKWEEEWTVGKGRKVPKQKADDSVCGWFKYLSLINGFI